MTKGEGTEQLGAVTSEIVFVYLARLRGFMKSETSHDALYGNFLRHSELV